MDPLMALAYCGSAFLGAGVGTAYAIKQATKFLAKHIDQDPDVSKIEIRVVMNRVDD